jgi:hypothetical protein
LVRDRLVNSRPLTNRVVVEDENAELGKQIENRDQQLAEMVNILKPALEELEKRSKGLEKLLQGRDQLISEFSDVVVPAAEARIDKLERRNLKLKHMIESYARSYLLTQEFVAALNHEKPENSELHKYIMNSKRFAHIREALEEDHFTDAEEIPDKSSPKSPSLTWRSSSATLRDKDNDRENTPTTSDRNFAAAPKLIHESKRMRAEGAEKGESGENPAPSLATLVKNIQEISKAKEEANSKPEQAGADKKEADARVDTNTYNYSQARPNRRHKEDTWTPSTATTDPQLLKSSHQLFIGIPSISASLPGYKRRSFFDEDGLIKDLSTPAVGANPPLTVGLLSVPTQRAPSHFPPATAAPTKTPEKALTNYSLDKTTDPSDPCAPRQDKAPAPPAVKLAASLKEWRAKASAAKLSESSAGERTPTTSSGEGSMPAPASTTATPTEPDGIAYRRRPDGTVYRRRSYLAREKSAPVLSSALGRETTSTAAHPPPSPLSASASAVGDWAANDPSPVAAKTDVDLPSSSSGGNGQWSKSLNDDSGIRPWRSHDDGGGNGARKGDFGKGVESGPRKKSFDVRKKREGRIS